MRARHVDEILGPQPLHGEEALLETPRRLFPRQAEGLELDVAVADAAAEYQFAAAHDVQRRQLLGDVQRLVQRQQHEPADETQARRQDRRLRQKRDLLQGLQRVRAVMRAFDQRIEAELLGPHDEVDVVCETGAHVVARGCWPRTIRLNSIRHLRFPAPGTLSSDLRRCKLGRAARKGGMR